MILLAMELVRSGVEVRTLTVGPGPLGERLDDVGLAWEILPFPRSLMVYGHQTVRARALRAAICLPLVWIRHARRFRRTTDVLHVNNLRGVLLVGPAARLAGVPVVWHVHLTDPMPVLNRLAARLSSAIVIPSAAELKNLVGVTTKAVRVIPNCVPPDVLEAPPAPGGTPLIATAARLTPQKGIDVLLAAMATVVAEVPEARLLVLGGTQTGYEDYAVRVKQATERLGLEDVVTFAGYVERPFEHWKQASIYVQPSRFEILPMAVLEAMAHGLPIIASAVGGIPELVVNGHTGILVPPADADQLAAAILTLLADPGLAHRMGHAGRTRAMDKFSLDSMTEQVLQLYRELPKHRQATS